MNRRLTAENMYNVGWHEGRELYIILKPCLLTPYMISCSTSVSPCYVLRDARLPLCLRTCTFSVIVPLCVYVYCSAYIIQYPCVCVYNVKHRSVCGRIRCIVPVNMSNNWLKRFCIQGMWGTNSVFERLIILKWPKLHLCLEIIYFWNCNTTCQGQNIEWKLFSWQLYKHREHQKTTQY